jgi:hypothetical protein
MNKGEEEEEEEEGESSVSFRGRCDGGLFGQHGVSACYVWVQHDVVCSYAQLFLYGNYTLLIFVRIKIQMAATGAFVGTIQRLFGCLVVWLEFSQFCRLVGRHFLLPGIAPPHPIFVRPVVPGDGIWVSTHTCIKIIHGNTQMPQTVCAVHAH